MGWYYNIYDALVNALFEGVAPAGALDFICQQISCYICLFAVLLPLIFAVSFFVKALRL